MSWPCLGADEAGKGDYFGHLVVAAVALRGVEEAEELAARGVRDSKRLSEGRISQLAPWIRSRFPFEEVAISPRRYNELYEKIGNLNRLLAWAHARAIENLLARAGGRRVVIDQFGPARELEQALFERGRAVEVVQVPRGEIEPAVAAASVLARERFLRELDRLARARQVPLPRGATHVLEAGQKLVALYGPGVLREVAKLHFRTTRQILGGEEGMGCACP